MTTKRWRSIVIKCLFTLLMASFLSACGGSSSSNDTTDTPTAGEPAKWSFSWDDGSVWQ